MAAGLDFFVLKPRRQCCHVQKVHTTMKQQLVHRRCVWNAMLDFGARTLQSHGLDNIAPRAISAFLAHAKALRILAEKVLTGTSQEVEVNLIVQTANGVFIVLLEAFKV